MITDQTLSSAIERGILSPEQVAQLNTLVRTDSAFNEAEPEDPEKLRFVSGFNDIFVTMGIVLFTGPLAYIVGYRVGLGPAWIALVVASWALAEFFTRRRRMALPSIVLLCLFAVSVLMGSMALVVLYVDGVGAFKTVVPDGLRNHWTPMNVIIAACSTLMMVALHYWRFRVPISVAAGAAALTLALVAVCRNFFPDSDATIRLVITVAGLGLFSGAMYFDLSDPARVTRRTDIAFWLHLLAAPMIVHPFVSRLVAAISTPRIVPTFGSPVVAPTGDTHIGLAVTILGILVLLAVIALIIDRRAILVAGLGYAGVAFAQLVRGFHFTGEILPAVTLLTLGALILLLSAGWRPARKLILRSLPRSLARNLPHPSASS